ncbi:putative ester cyclase [Kibdelosporangium banguiense]|uniref:Ester cyclase n=1 Tax=Kibdelosporangium banguiense TaxID=1365924 RepID=A0ABS4TGS8_9PSEU|nr:ester cyclase [Kibdelosporangium banguiense]MBP2323541.1 putative ester cyclase [Kibdelosporangium banguiense]
MTMSDQERIAMQRRTIDEHIKGENEHDWVRVYDTFLKDERAYYDVVPFSIRYPGIRGVQDFYEIIEAAIPDFRVVVTGEYDTPGASVREVTITGTHRGEYCGVVPQGRPVSVEVAAFYVFGEGDESGKLLAERIYYDNETLLQQMRGEQNALSGVGLASASGLSLDDPGGDLSA